MLLTKVPTSRFLQPGSVGTERHRTAAENKRAKQHIAKAESSAVPRVTLEFQTAEGNKTLECDSGDILRDVMLEQKVDLYTTWGKVWQCGGSGQCGTCIVKVLDSSSVLSEKNATELKKLKQKPEDYRLACQTNVGDGTNSATVVVQTKPR